MRVLLALSEVWTVVARSEPGEWSLWRLVAISVGAGEGRR